jgi:hypothetical protein
MNLLNLFKSPAPSAPGQNKSQTPSAPPQATITPIFERQAPPTLPAVPSGSRIEPPATPPAPELPPQPPPARNNENVTGIQAQVLEIAERNGWTIRLEGFDRHRTPTNKIFTTVAAQPHGIIPPEVMRRIFFESDLQFDPAKIKRLKEIKNRIVAQNEKKMRFAFTRENTERLVAEDEKLAGTANFQGLQQNRTRVSEILSLNLSRLHTQLKSIAAEATPLLIEIGELVRKAIQKKLAEQIETELRESLSWQLPFLASHVIATIIQVDEQIESQLTALRYGCHEADPSPLFWGIVGKLMERENL